MEEIEQRAEAILEQVPSWIWDGQSLPVPVEEIADTCYGLLVRDAPDMAAAPGSPELEPGQTLSGLLLADRGEIWVNAEEAREWPPRRRFTIGHELGHWVLHCDLGQAPGSVVECRTESLTEEGAVEADAGRQHFARSTHYPMPEIEANQFAAAMLMPRALVEKEHAWVEGDLWRLAQAFGVSTVAMKRRLWFLGQSA
jgi:uncharacterized protein DUF955